MYTSFDQKFDGILLTQRSLMLREAFERPARRDRTLLTVRFTVIWSTFFSVFQTFRGSLTAVSTPIFASKGAFFSVFRVLHFFLCTIPEFCDFSRPLHHVFSQKRNKSRPNYRESDSTAPRVLEHVDNWNFLRNASSAVLRNNE